MMSKSAGEAPSTSTVSDSLPRARATSTWPFDTVGTIDLGADVADRGSQPRDVAHES